MGSVSFRRAKSMSGIEQAIDDLRLYRDFASKQETCRVRPPVVNTRLLVLEPLHHALNVEPIGIRCLRLYLPDNRWCKMRGLVECERVTLILLQPIYIHHRVVRDPARIRDRKHGGHVNLGRDALLVPIMFEPGHIDPHGLGTQKECPAPQLSITIGLSYGLPRHLSCKHKTVTVL